MRSAHRLILALTVCALAVGLAPLFAESSPEAVKALENLMSMNDRGPFTVDYDIEMKMEQGEQSFAATGNGSMTQKDDKHSRMKMTLNMAMPGMEQKMQMSMLTVSDGTHIWTEMNMFGGQQIMKMSFATAEKMGEMGQGGMGAGSPGSMDPVKQMKEMTDAFDFEVIGREGGTLTLRGKLSEAGKAKLGDEMVDNPELATLDMMIDEASGMPKEFRVGGDTPFMVMRFGNWKWLDAATIDAGLFSYTPPEGAMVMDMDQMLSGQGGQ